MAAPRNTRTTHPARSPQTEAMLKDRSIAFEFEPNLAVSEIREADGYQVRLTKNRAPKEQVAKYSTAMKHGATFPAVVLNENYELIDGNTRLQARLRNSGETIAAYILFGVTALDARSLSVELNQSNGLQMNDEEIYGFIANAVKDGQQPEVRALARMTGVREPKITRWIAEIHFLERAAQMGIAERHLNALPASTRAALQATRLEAVFEEITTLAAEAKLPTAFVKKMVGQVNGAPSEQAALELISTERAQRVDEIRAVASGFSPRDRASKGSAQHLGGLQRFDVDALLDVAPEKQFETFQRMKILRDRLDTAVTRAANEWDLTPPAEPAGDDETPVAEPAAAA
jgi:ParB-like nuclease domain